MQKFKHLFFDLDHTLWDFDANEKISLNQLFIKHKLDNHFDNFDEFFSIYQPINESLWSEYSKGLISKKNLTTERFHKSFCSKGLDNYDLAIEFGKEFITLNSSQTTLIPHTTELLEYLTKKRYSMYIITNGFIETQYKKLRASKLDKYFKKMYISEEVGSKKPHHSFFEYAIKSSNARKTESLVIGDNLEADIKGAINFGLSHVYFNPNKIEHDINIYKEISSLEELIGWL